MDLAKILWDSRQLYTQMVDITTNS